MSQPGEWFFASEHSKNVDPTCFTHTICASAGQTAQSGNVAHRRNVFSFVLVLAIMLGLTSCFSPDQVTRTIRVIAQAEVDGKIVEGSAVMAVRWQPCCNGGVQRSSKTEAVILELNDKHTVYVLDATMRSDGETNGSYWTGYVGNALGIKRSVRKSDFDLIEKATGKFPVLASISRTKTMPVMVSFEDETKRETMFHVTSENISEKFGANVKFIGIWFEFTDDPVTEAIEARLPLMFQGENNESYNQKYFKRDKDGKSPRIDEKEIPPKFGQSAFKKARF